MDRKLLINYAIKYQGNYSLILKAIKNEEDIIINNNVDAITILDDDYPTSLKELKYPPFVLFYIGDRSLLNMTKISIVGSRIVNEYGIQCTEVIVDKLNTKYCIVSGLAKGIDALAHEYALKKHKTIAVLGSGINYVYPKSNNWLYNILKFDHLIISEYPFICEPRKYYFPWRNRIIAALGEKLIVVQAKENSGTMLSVNEALSLNKEIYVIPHPVDDELGVGCNKLIQEGANILLTEDIDML